MLQVKRDLKKLIELLREERELLLVFPLKDLDRFKKIQEEKRELLLKISSFSKEEVEREKELLVEIHRLNTSISALVSNGLSFFEEVEKELFGESATYRRNRANSLFNRKA